MTFSLDPGQKLISAIFAFAGKNDGEMAFLVPVWEEVFFEFSEAF